MAICVFDHQAGLFSISPLLCNDMYRALVTDMVSKMETSQLVNVTKDILKSTQHLDVLSARLADIRANIEKQKVAVEQEVRARNVKVTS